MQVNDILICKKKYEYANYTIFEIGDRVVVDSMLNMSLNDDFYDVCNLKRLKDGELFLMYTDKNRENKSLINGSYIYDYFYSKIDRVRMVIDEYNTV